MIRLFDSVIQCLVEAGQLQGLEGDQTMKVEIDAQVTAYKAFRYMSQNLTVNGNGVETPPCCQILSKKNQQSRCINFFCHVTKFPLANL